MKMSKYTTEVRYICEYEAGLTESAGYLSINEVIDSAYPKIFNFNFPIFDNAYKPVLCKKILKHYYTREIGEETVGLWKLRLETRLNEIMPYYNKLYQLLNQDISLFDDTNLHKTGNRTGESEKEGTANGTDTNTQTFNDTITENSSGTATKDVSGTQKNLFSDTPQGALTNVDNERYLTDARKIIDDSEETDTVSNTGTRAHTGTVSDSGTNSNEYGENINTTDEYVEHIFGKAGGKSYIELLEKYKHNIIDIDMMIITELQDLFMNIW